MEDEKDAYYVVRKGDIVGFYKSLNDCQSLLCGPDVAVFKGYRLSKVAEKYLATHGLSGAIYSVGVSNVQGDIFGQLIPCPFQQPNFSTEKVGSKTYEKEKKDIGSTSLSEAPQRKLPETESFIEALPVSAHCCSCILEFDGAAKGNPGPAGAGVVLRAVDGSLVCFKMPSDKLLYCLDASANASPFTSYAFDPYLPEFGIPNNIGTYDGTTDPGDHLFVFTRTMSMSSHLIDRQWPRCFAITLRGKARIWFETLRPNSISSFNQLGKIFRTRFIHKVKLKQSTNDILKMIPQRSHESFKDFFERFNDEVLMTEIGNRLEDFEELMINIFINKLKPCPCLEDFTAKPPSTLEDLLVRAHLFARLEAGLVSNKINESHCT